MSQADRDVSVSNPRDAQVAPARGPVPLDLTMLRHVSGGLPKGSWKAAGLVASGEAGVVSTDARFTAAGDTLL